MSSHKKIIAKRFLSVKTYITDGHLVKKWEIGYD